MIPLRGAVGGGFALCLVVLATVGVSAVRSTSTLLDTVAAESSARRFVLELRDVLSLIDDCETAQRGYVITGDESFLEPYAAMSKRIDDDLAEVERLLPTGEGLEARFERLKELIDDKLAFAEQAVDVRRELGFEAARDLVVAGRGKQLMDAIRRLVAAIERDHAEHLLQHQNEVAAATSRTRAVIALGSVIAIVVVVAATLLSFREIGRREHTEDALENRAEELHEAFVELDRVRHEQLQIKDQLLSNVSHELRTPLNASYQFLTLVLDGVAGEITAEQRDYLEVALRNTKQLRTMIGDLLDVARLDGGRLAVEPRATDLAELVRDTARMFRPSGDEVDIVIAAEGDLPLVLADPSRVRQVLINLIDNAIKVSVVPMTLQIDLRRHDLDGSLVHVAVTDRGTGIASELLPHLFDRLYQVPGRSDINRKGLGIGLYICRELVTRQGGSIWVESEVDVGSTFHFTLPVAVQSDMIDPSIAEDRE